MTSRAMGWLAFGLMVSGIVLGFVTLDIGGAKCGSLFTGRPNDDSDSSAVVDFNAPDSDVSDAASKAVADAACSEVRTQQWRTAIPLLVVGVFIGLGAAHVADGESKQQRSESP